jgi:beta-barrel assembly-enhancing protease
LPALLILIVILIVLFNPGILPGMGSWLGGKSRKPFHQAKWVWSSFTGTEDETIQAERDYGRECAREFAKQFSGNVSPRNQEITESVGARLAKAVKDPRREFRFTVAASPQANAFALPGGFIFITESLLNLCENDPNEIAFILAHEIGHILRGHAKDHLTANVFLSAISSQLSSAGRMIREVLSKGYSRSMELEADQEAARLVAAAGFDARASIQALNRLAKVSPDISGLMEYVSSHPAIPDRIRELEQFLNTRKM